MPIVSAEVSADKVSVWNRASGSGRPLRAVWLTNASGLTLDGGSITLIDGNAFAGEGLVDPLKPGERRLILCTADLGVLVKAQQEGAASRLVRIRARNGVITQDTEERASWTSSPERERR